jgi:fimbrial isopeptide formation D2 family protein
VFSGDTVSLEEAFIRGDPADYETTLNCDSGVTVTGGSFVVPPTPPPGVPITCTFTNTRRQATLTVQKEWVNAAASDQAGLTITGTDAATLGAATSTATGATGSHIDTTDQANATIFAGETVTVNEDLPPGGHTNVGSYTSQTTCDPATNFTGGAGGQGGTLVVPSTPVDVICTIANTRVATSELTLQKAWANGFPGDTTDLSAVGILDSGSTTAADPGDGAGLSANKVVIPETAGESVHLAETLAADDVGTYVPSLTCDHAGLVANPDGLAGTFTVTTNPQPVTCTFTNIAAAPDPTVTKTVESNTQNSDGTWTIVYDIAVTDPDPSRPTLYTLTDTLAFGHDIAVNSAKVTGAGASPSWNGTSDTTIVTDASLGPGATEHYTVTVNATVPADATSNERLCSAGGGFDNRAQVALPALAGDQQASACADPASPTIAKKVVSVLTGSAPGRWMIKYDVTVTDGTLTSLSYSLHDQLGFPSGVTVTSSSAARVHSALDGSGATAPEPIPGWTGTGSATALATNQPLAARSIDTYTVSVGVTVASGVPPQATACSAAGPGHGYFNSATMTSGSDSFSANACAAIVAPTSLSPTAVATAAPAAPSAPKGPLPFSGLALAHEVLNAAALIFIGGALVALSGRRRSRRFGRR